MKSLVIVGNLKKYYVFFPRIYFYCKNIYFNTEFHVKTFFVTFLLFCDFFCDFFVTFLCFLHGIFLL
jgi:hypothetical protein